MTDMRSVRVLAGVSGLVVLGFSLGGCATSPTYGTGVTAAEQLMDDLGSAASIGSSKKTAGVKYTPRPGLVVPGKGEEVALVEPQASIADKTNGQWLESPEEMRARVARETDENANNPNYKSAIQEGRKLSSKDQWAAFREARKVQEGNYEGRRYLSDPPVSYRQADPAVLQDLGEPEKAKEKRRKKAAAMAKSGSNWWNPFQ